MGVKVSFKDLGLGRIFGAVKELEDTRVKVGIVGPNASKPSPDGRLTIAQQAIINEYGSSDGHVPPRHTFGTLSQRKQLVARLTSSAIERVVEGESTATQSASVLGEQLAQHLRNMIDDGVQPENAEATVDKKGFDHPLIETGAMKDAISYQVIGGSNVPRGGGSAEYESMDVESDEGGSDYETFEMSVDENQADVVDRVETVDRAERVETVDRAARVDRAETADRATRNGGGGK